MTNETMTNETMKTATAKSIIEFHVFIRDNYSCTDRQRIHYRTSHPTLAGLAAALDRAHLDGIEQCGCSGSGAGAWVEAVFDIDDEDKNIVVDNIESPILGDCEPLEIGASRLALARRAGKLERSRVWDGHNFVTTVADNTRRLMEIMGQ